MASKRVKSLSRITPKGYVHREHRSAKARRGLYQKGVRHERVVKALKSKRTNNRIKLMLKMVLATM